tara:strand:- start:510 stop:1682 length:1173 start_codon:yes stop_codon:yes gene_type:complete
MAELDIERIEIVVDPNDPTTKGAYFNEAGDLVVIGKAVAKVDCPKVIIPSADDLEEIIIQIVNRYGAEYLEPIEEILGVFPLSHNWSADLDIPELYWENKIQCIIEEFKLFPQIKFAEVVSKLVPIELKFKVPPFGIEVDCLRLLNDPDYKGELIAELRKMMEEMGDEFDALLPDFTKENWDGTKGIDWPDIKLSKAWKELIGGVKDILEGGLFAAIGKLLGKSPVKEIVELLPDPIGFLLELCISVPAGKFKFDTDAFFKKIIEEAEEAGEDAMQALLDTEIPFVSEVPSILGLDDILPKTLGDLINLDIEDKQIDFPAWNTQKLYERFKTFIQDLPQILLEACLQKLTKLISFIVPSGFPLPFTICSFLEIIGFPKEIDITKALMVET